MTGLTQHPLSAAFPAMSPVEFADLVEDIRAHGLRLPITIFERQVLDGWHRYRACEELGIKANAVSFPDGDDPVSFVRSQNSFRRHLTGSQKSAIEVELGKWAPPHRPIVQDKGEAASPFPRTNEEMATAAGVSVRTIRQAKRAVEAGLGEVVKSGQITVERAAAIAKLPESERAAAIEAPVPPRAKATPVVDLQPQLDERLDDLRELASLLAITEEDNKSMARVLEADDRVAAALAEAKRYRELARITQERNNGLMGQNHALGQAAKRWMNKFLRLEKVTKGQNTTKPEDFTPFLAEEVAGVR